MTRSRRRVGRQRREDYGGYSREQVDAALRETLRSDWPSIVLRLVVLAAVYTLLARAILAGMSSPYLVLPLLLEVLLIFWLGWVLTRTAVDCETFRKGSGSFALCLFWTAGIGAVVLVALAFDRQQEALDPAQILPRLERMQAVIVEHRLHWAMAAMAGGLLVSTAMDIARWRAQGGVFFWSSITHAGFRMAMLIVAVPVIGVPAIMLGELLVELLLRLGWADLLGAQLWAWPVWAFLLLLDLAATVVGVLMHRDLLAEASTPAKA